MSFCSDVKNELADLRLSGCCKPSLLYGFMLFGRSFSLKRICLQTQNEYMAQKYCELIYQVYKIKPSVTHGGKTRITYRAEIPNETDRLKILNSVGFDSEKIRINRDLFKRECCSAAFIRGAFLACGSVSDPNLEYRADFSVKNADLADDLSELLSEHGIFAKKTVRNGVTVVYIKDSGMVEDLLTLLGDTHRSLEIMDAKIIKSVKNNINRKGNCDTGNISKAVEASIMQRKAIDFLEKSGRLYSLPEELLTAAMLRKNNPELTLKELCRLSPDALTVSGLNHRFKRIIDLYNDLNKE